MMEQELIDPSANDPASKAFDRLRREVTTMRLAIEHLADAPGKIEIPDYTETLTQIDGRITATHKALRTLADRPAIALTPETLAQQIAAAGVEARRVDQTTFDKATSTFVTLGRELSSVTASARTAQAQAKAQLWWGGGGVVLGMVAALILPFIAINLAPTSWHWPERRAASILGLDMWEAGQQLMIADGPEEWNAIAATSRASKTSRSVIARCQAMANKTSRVEKCMINVAPEAAKAK
jgi:Family of unknown function (DUF6118)